MLLDLTLFDAGSYTAQSLHAIGQVAQLVERGPEKAGVGGSIPSLATTKLNPLQLKNRVKFLARTIRAHRFAFFSLLASLVQIASTFIAPCR